MFVALFLTAREDRPLFRGQFAVGLVLPSVTQGLAIGLVVRALLGGRASRVLKPVVLLEKNPENEKGDEQPEDREHYVAENLQAAGPAEFLAGCGARLLFVIDPVEVFLC